MSYMFTINWTYLKSELNITLGISEYDFTEGAEEKYGYKLFSWKKK